MDNLILVNLIMYNGLLCYVELICDLNRIMKLYQSMNLNNQSDNGFNSTEYIYHVQ